jgi:hypothetical protein
VIALPLDTPVEVEVIVEIAPPDTAPGAGVAAG